MKNFITWVLIIVALTAATAALACNTNIIYTPDGRMLTCQTCCYGGQCTTTCY